ncbi:MAG TPA: gluconokinase [Methylibium sp.]
MKSIVIMGVAGSGKSSLARAVAAEFGVPMVEGDDFHPPANLAKMRSGTPLDDADRAGWLAALGAELQRLAGGAVLSCSALKRAYRASLREAVPDLKFVFLEIDRASARERVATRAAEHLFPASLVDSQFAVLEPPMGEPGVLTLKATEEPGHLQALVRAWIASGGS